MDNVARELRDPQEARRFLLQGLWWQRVLAPVRPSVQPALALALEVAASGALLPPVGFVADVGNAVLGAGGENRSTPSLPGVPAVLLRTYEDHVLSKLYVDWTFNRAADALRRYEGRDQLRGLAFLLTRLCERMSIGGVELSPAVIKTALEMPPEQALREGWDSQIREGPQPLLLQLYGSLPGAARRVAEVLGPEDVFELEHRTALAEPAERLA